MSNNIHDGLESMFRETYFKEKIPEDYTQRVESQKANTVVTALQGLMRMVNNCSDLDFKLLKNKTATPFITSDNPVVKYNQFLELKKSMASANGIVNKGVQLFIALDDSTMLLFYDSWAYKVGDKRKRIIEVTSEDEVNQLNVLHFLNCNETLYFNQKASKTFIQALYEKSKKYERSNVIKTTRIPDKFCKDTTKKNSELVITNFSDCRTRLNLSFIKMKDDAKRCELDGRLAYPRAKYRR